MEVTATLAHHAGFLAEKHALRGYDAVHLATGLMFAEQFKDLSFLAFDKRLNDAAKAAGLRLYDDSLQEPPP